MSECDERRVKVVNDVIDSAVTGLFPTLFCRNGAYLSVDSGYRAFRLLEGQPLNQLNERRRNPSPFTLVRPLLFGKPNQSLGSIEMVQR